jgi:hypothetical protein
MIDLKSLSRDELEQELSDALKFINVYIDGLNTRKFDIVVTNYLKERDVCMTSGELIKLVKEVSE